MATQQNTDGSYTLTAPNTSISPTAFSANGGTPVVNNANLASMPSQTTNASDIALNQNSQGLSFPNAPQGPTNGVGANTTIPTPVPSAESIINNGAATTPAEATNQSLLARIAQSMGMKQGQTELTNAAETAGGVPELSKTVNDLNTQLQGLNDQATALQNQAGEYGSIQNAQRLAESGGNIEAAMHGRPQTRDQLLQNQIQQSAIATQALTVKSALYGAQGNLALAKDAADKAATAQYEHQQNQIDYLNSLIDANKPQMTKEEQAQADIVKAKLADRQSKIDNAKEDKKTIIALATAALKNNPNDPAAQYAAQQALAESNQAQPDLQKAFSLVGNYQTNPLDVQKQLLDLQATRANIVQSYASAGASNASAAKTRAEMQMLQNPSSNTVSQVTGKPLTADERTAQGYAARSTNADQVISQLGSKFTGIQYGFSSLMPNQIKSPDQQKYEQAQRDFVNAVLRKESGAAISDSEFSSASKQYFPQAGDSPAVIAQKTANRAQTIKNLQLDGGVIPTTQQPKQIQYQGKTYNVDAQGNMTPL